MKVYLSDTGDWSVGIWPLEITIKVNWDLPVDIKERELRRKEMIQMITDYFDPCGRVLCHFEDECPTCWSILEKGKCGNEGCIDFREVEKNEMPKM